MTARFSYPRSAPGVYDAMDALDRYLATSAVDEALLALIKLRASQINGCAYCIDSHWRELETFGEPAHRLYSLDAWRETPFYSARERAALAWTDAVTLIASGHVPDAVYDEVRPHFSDTELADLTLAIATINAWNRLSIASRLVPASATAAKT